jgi:hypothetical protein
MEQPINEPFTSEESQEIYQNFKTIINSRLDKLYNSKGSDGEQYAYSIAVKQMRKKQAEKLAEPTPEEPTTEEPMEQGDKLKEMIQSALSKPLNEKKKSFPDLTGDGQVTKADILKARGVELDEDLDLGHEDNEPHMLKADLYRIGKYAMELYKMVDQFEGKQEVDFPHWWQAKIIEAKNMLVSAKHYLDFELKEPQLDAMVDVASEEGAIDEKMTPEKSRKIGMPFKNKIKEAILAKLKNQTPVDENIFTGRNDMHMGSSYSDYSSNSDISIDILASKIAKALKNPKNQNEDDQNNIKQARKALNLGDIKVAEKIAKPYIT